MLTFYNPTPTLIGFIVAAMRLIYVRVRDHCWPQIAEETELYFVKYVYWPFHIHSLHIFYIYK